jgi:hypothetical protein
MRLMLSAIVLMSALAAGTAATCSTSIAPKVAVAHPDGGFGRGYGVFHSYGWARGGAGYAQGACYWRPELCAKDTE